MSEQPETLEEMGQFFDARLHGYEEHQLTSIEGAREFYPFSASLLPMAKDCKILDLGCGTGLEMDYFFSLNPHAAITAIDLASGMLARFKNKFASRNITTILGSFFETDFPQNTFDAAIAVEAMHHYSQKEKIPLYSKIRKALAPAGYFILCDYFSRSINEEMAAAMAFERLKIRHNPRKGILYHVDIPLTPSHEIESLREAGFGKIELLRQWGSTCCIRACK